jgi:DNA-binding transcriptional ArsR family regulator
MINALAVLAAPRRQAILRLVWRQERAAGDIYRALGDVSFGAVSQHLGTLTEQGLVRVRAEGRQRYYRACREALGPVAAVLEAMWDDALYELKLRAELEAGRRGPKPRRRRPGRRGGTP